MVWNVLNLRPSDERHESALVPETDIHVALKREEQPEWRCVYTASLPRSCKLKVELRSWALGRMDSSEITQSNGKWVLFDLKAPADKILDRELLPDVERLCAEIQRMDHEFLASRPNEFTDERGDTWRRVD